MQIVFGIDFGTTNSALSVYRNGAVEMVALDGAGTAAALMRSVLYFNEENEIFAGQEAIRQYVDDGAGGRFMQSIKTFLPNSSFDGTEVFGRRYAIEDLVAIILKRIKAQGENHVGRSVDSVVLGRPVLFSSDPAKDSLAQRRLEKAARKAGFSRIWFQYEPVAAALTFEETLRSGEERVVFIGDFGGGTSDFSVIRVRGGDSGRSDRRGDVLSLGGVYIAGDSFDSQIMWDRVARHFGRYARYKTLGKDEWVSVPRSITHTLCQWHRIPLLRARATREHIRVIKGSTDDRRAIENLENIISDNYGFFLFQAIEKAKCELSGQERAMIRFSERDLCINEEIDRDGFEAINGENFQRIADCVDEVVSGSGLAPEQMDTVFLTGGTSRIPRIQSLFAQRFGKEKLEQRNAFTSVAHGLGSSVPLFA
ncbi:Hsp70 family protein [Pelobacter propionicus]|uniref:Molecular chaperone-like protein n=1 Tax=Pelobacter propionicus (strain DSM 2379 / NBRC 103807 / OttBd1) TaxID=338966 RepID=A1AQY3_PELPD|nr:Hsp70 family protein [Pelobacter propionicus]ABK99753.1 molecular chaperone-like protein [Pelobacter propionicus DSM 2379]